MHGFTQYTPTRIIFGKETQKQAGELAKSLGATKVFVVYGGGSVVRSGLLDQVTACLLYTSRRIVWLLIWNIWHLRCQILNGM